MSILCLLINTRTRKAQPMERRERGQSRDPPQEAMSCVIEIKPDTVTSALKYYLSVLGEGSMPITSDVQLGEGVTIPHPELVNLYGCSVGEHSRIGAFVEVKKKGFCWRKLQDLFSQLHMR